VVLAVVSLAPVLNNLVQIPMLPLPQDREGRHSGAELTRLLTTRIIGVDTMDSRPLASKEVQIPRCKGLEHFHSGNLLHQAVL
jgi:hypothetical protein